MLTRAEKRFAENPGQFTDARQRLYRCRINKKLQSLASDLRMLAEQNDKLGLRLHLLSEFFQGAAFQDSRSGHGTGQHPDETKTFLDSLQDW